jgi:hypothetical protein
LDQDLLRSAYRELNDRPCPYEKAILADRCACTLARRFCIAEREGVGCEAAAAQADCTRLIELLRGQARFALRTADAGTALPNAKAMRIQVGGLRGIEAALSPGAPIQGRIPDIRATLVRALAAFGSLDALPFQEIVRQIAAFRGRPSARRRHRPGATPTDH